MKKALIFLVSVLLLCSCSNSIRSIAEERSESAIKEWIKDRAAKKSNMPLLDFSIKQKGVVIDNDSICSLLFDLSVTTSKNGTETKPVSYTMVKDKAMSKLEGKDVFKELVDYKGAYVITEENLKSDIELFNNTNIEPTTDQAEKFVYNCLYNRILEEGNPLP